MSERQGKQSKLIQSRWYFVGYTQDISLEYPHIFSIYSQRFALCCDHDNQLICYLLPQTENFCFKSFLAVEKQGIIWLWYGKQELADENLITVMDSRGKAIEDDN